MIDELALDLYHATKNCKEGNCNNCPRKEMVLGRSYNYMCKQMLLKDCFRFFDLYTEDFEE